MKQRCRICNKQKVLTDFYKNKNRKNGFNSECKDCHKDYIKGYTQRPEIKKKMAKQSLEFYKKNKQKIISNVNIYNKTRDRGLYFKYWTILRRCKYKSQANYKYYGGRGIKCLWTSYDSFKQDMYCSYIKHIKKHGHKQTTIDRIDVDGHYCNKNCRWSTKLEQARNKRKNVDKCAKLQARGV